MIDPRAMKNLGSTNERLREILTAKMPDKPKDGENYSDAEKEQCEKREEDCKLRKKFEEYFQNKLDERVLESVRDYRFYSVIDLAWDSDPINRQTLPLVQFAQGLINVETCVKDLESLGMTQFIKRDEKEGPPTIDLPLFFTFNVNLVRSIINRRLAAQSNKFSNVWPFFKYEARGSSNEDKLRSDVTSQRMDIMADQMGYRHNQVQWIRDAMLHGWSANFACSAWDVKKTIEIENDGKDLPEEQWKTVTKIEREGVKYFHPHPTRVFWDDAHPLSTINDDLGCQFAGYWDIRRYSDIVGQRGYFNADAVQWSSAFWDQLINTGYPSSYNCTVSPPSVRNVRGGLEPGVENDQKSTFGLYTTDTKDASTLVAQFYRRLIPKEVGWGDYPEPVWVRFVVAGNQGTVVFAEWMPSLPVAYLGINQNDSRRKSLSLAHEILPFQDQMTNLVTQMLKLAQLSMVKIADIDTSNLSEEQIKKLQGDLQSRNLGSNVVVIASNHADNRELGIKDSKRINMTDISVGETMSGLLRAMAELTQLAERNLSMSPAEQGQPIEREASATEVNEISNTTQSVYSFISDSIDEGRSAMKKICYESLIAMGQEYQVMPVQHRYTKKTIESAGFKVVPSGDYGQTETGAQRYTVAGNKKNLVAELIFTTRDGAERASNAAAANTLAQLAGTLVTMPGVMQAMGKERFYSLLNEIFRLSGSGFDLNLEMQEGESNDFEDPKFGQLVQMVQQLGESVKQIGEQGAANSEELAKIDQILPQIGETIRGSQPQSPPQPQPLQQAA
jgi:hypothetical protein